MGRRSYLNRICAISYPSRVEGWLDVCETEGSELTRLIKTLPWGPLYCVLQQDDQSFTAYCSEEISLGDVSYEDIPRIRLDRVRRPAKALWDGPPTLAEENEDSDSCLGGGTSGFTDIMLNTTLYSELGEYKSKTLPRIHFDTALNDTSLNEDTSYEKACRRGSAPTTPILGSSKQHQPEQNATSRFTNFFSKRSNPLKRTKSVTKLERTKRGSGGLRGSRSHESLLSSHAVMSTIDLSCTGAVGVAPVHQSVLGRRHCFQVRGGPRGERYYSCGSRQERDLWIYSLRKSIAPNAEHQRRTDNSLKLWVYEAKNLPPKKKYFCELQLDKTLYGRTSVKLQTDLLFWGEYFDFPDIPEINVITVNVFREVEKKKKRDKYQFVGAVKIPLHEVTSRLICEDWYPILSEKASDSLGRKDRDNVVPTLRIKCRFQSTDILPINVYGNFLAYLKENYKRVCETLEPVIGVKAKEDIGQALVLLMHAQGLASAFLTDVVALDLLRVGDQRLTFRGNSLATKSMEAFLKLTGEQYLQDTLSGPINELILADRDCEVDPTKMGSSSSSLATLQRQQAALRSAVKHAWQCIYESHKHFPPQLRACFATFRERLQQLGRQDMADNLISASIFLRFLCPAILSPSLFNITSELPSSRATRNLTLVAKTLQTLANFTRFQGKENFMEFLNDFLEQEAERMQQFLEIISTRSEGVANPDSILDWAGYIDQGKQLSILHTLLSESLGKLPEARQHELDPLQHILEEISSAKQLGYHLPSSENQENRNDNVVAPSPAALQQAQLAQPQHAVISKPVPSERGIMRGVLTPSSLEKNIFRYNDPTVNGMLQQQPLQYTPHQYPPQHPLQLLSNSQSSIAASEVLQHAQSQSSMASSSLNGSSNNLLHPPSSIHPLHCPLAPQTSAASTMERMDRMDRLGQSSYQYVAHNGISNDYEGASSSSSRARTLPRNNNNNNNSNINSSYDDMHGEFQIQISGLDTSSAFVRKSPTPLMKAQSSLSNSNTSSGRSRQQQQLLHSSNASLSYDPQAAAHKLNLGIPDHSAASSKQQQQHYQRALINSNSNSHSNMPMNLEDLDDLFKYAEEHDVAAEHQLHAQIQQQQQQQQQHNNNSNTNMKLGKEQLSAKSSHCSSGYQSISTNPSPSQSSSPVENHQQQLVAQQKMAAAAGAPLAFKNPSYQLQSGHHHLPASQQRAQLQHQHQPQPQLAPQISMSYGQNRSIVKPLGGGIVAARAAFLNSGGALDPAAIHTLTPSSSDEHLSAADNYYSGFAAPSSSVKPPSSAGHLEAQRSLSGDSNSSSTSCSKNNAKCGLNLNLSSGGGAISYVRPPLKREDVYGGGVGGAVVFGNSSGSNYAAAMSTPNAIHAHPQEHKQCGQADVAPINNSSNNNNSNNSAGGRYQRRLSLDSARTLSDSSTDTEGHCTQLQEGKRRRQLRQSSNHSGGGGGSGSGGNAEEALRKSYDQNGEIQLLQETLDTLRHTLDRDEAELRDSSDELFALQRPAGSGSGGSNGSNNLSLQSESTMRSIIDRLITMEEELRREQLKMSQALSHKQRVIEEQGQQIAALDAANSRLLSALTALRQRYETQQQHQQQQAPKNQKPQ